MKKSNEQAEIKPCTIHGVMSSALTENEIKIAQIQSAMKKLGYQWKEHQFNDGFDEVYLEIAKDNDVSTFDRNKEDAGWGRMGRLTAWTNALEWAIMKNKKGIDLSKHVFSVEEVGGIFTIFDLKLSEYEKSKRITFICGKGITSITGDYGNWIFDRELHPHDEYISRDWADEKLITYSIQKPYDFCSEETLKAIITFEDEFEDYFEREMNEEEKDWIEDLKNNVFSETEYKYFAFGNKPSVIDYEQVPYVEVRNHRLEIIYDAFNYLVDIIKSRDSEKK